MDFGTSLEDAYGLPSMFIKSTPLNDVHSAPAVKYNPMIEPLTQQEIQQQVPTHVLSVPVPAPASAPANQVQQQHTDLLDNWFTNRRAVTKTITFVLMIVLGIATYTLFDFWLKEIVAQHILSFRHELGIRIIFPIIVLVILLFLRHGK